MIMTMIYNSDKKRKQSRTSIIISNNYWNEMKDPLNFNIVFVLIYNKLHKINLPLNSSSPVLNKDRHDSPWQYPKLTSMWIFFQ